MDCHFCGKSDCVGCFYSLERCPIPQPKEIIAGYTHLQVNSPLDWMIAEQYINSTKKHNEFDLDNNLLLLLKGK